MRTFAIAAIVSVAVSSVAFAQAPKRISDSDYLRANRCAALASAPELGESDSAAYKALLKSQGRGRNEVVVSMGKRQQEKTAAEVRSSNQEYRETLRAERDGACKTLLG